MWCCCFGALKFEELLAKSNGGKKRQICALFLLPSSLSLILICTNFSLGNFSFPRPLISEPKIYYLPAKSSTKTAGISSPTQSFLFFSFSIFLFQVLRGISRICLVLECGVGG